MEGGGGSSCTDEVNRKSALPARDKHLLFTWDGEGMLHILDSRQEKPASRGCWVHISVTAAWMLAALQTALQTADVSAARLHSWRLRVPEQRSLCGFRRFWRTGSFNKRFTGFQQLKQEWKNTRNKKTNVARICREEHPIRIYYIVKKMKSLTF